MTDITTPAGAFTNKYFSDVKIVRNHFKPARMCQRLLIEPIAGQIFNQDLPAAGPLHKALIFLAAHPTHMIM
jgi:hypothetical protein